MNLPGPESKITWKDYQIATPTFQLTSVEKPDLSPFLIHLTGRDQLINILKGENAPDEITVNNGEGFLKSSIPAYGGGQFYNSSVVCFTESPLFALDFFRYRSFQRWANDQQFGIGFSKSDLINHRNVRPVLYLDSDTNSELLKFCNSIINKELNVIDGKGEIKNLVPLIEKLKPFLFPLLNERQEQGFMWEREWRCPNPNGLVFPLSAIKVICCPPEERREIEEILGSLLTNIQIVENWKEYDDVTNFLRQRESRTTNYSSEQIKNIGDLATLEALKLQNDQKLHTLSAYYNTFKETVDLLEGKNIKDLLQTIEKTSEEILSQINKLKKESIDDEFDRLLGL